jgi:LysM repeat protein
MYKVTVNELKAVVRANAQAVKSGAVSKISVEPNVQDEDLKG